MGLVVKLDSEAHTYLNLITNEEEGSISIEKKEEFHLGSIYGSIYLRVKDKKILLGSLINACKLSFTPYLHEFKYETGEKTSIDNL